MIAAGNYEGKAVRDPAVQFGESDKKGTLQLGIAMELFDTNTKQSVGIMTTILFFSDNAAEYAYQRLRAMGWKGQSADDIDKLDDIYGNPVPCVVKPPEKYQDTDGTWKMPSSGKLEIVTGGTLVMNKPLDASSFKARLKALGGGGGSSGPSNAGGPPPPF